jgi:hypothetical protein
MRRLSLFYVSGCFVLAAALALGQWRFHLFERLFTPEDYYFVTAREGQFFLRGEPFRFVGANTRLVHGDKQRAAVDTVFARAHDHGVRVVRQWVVGESPGPQTGIHRPVDRYYFQAGPNNWQEESFVHLDLMLARAADHDLKVILTLVNNWSDYGGVPMYLHWAGVNADPLSRAHHDSFYTDPRTQRWVQALAHKLVTRRNSVTGVLYRDDPTIFSWELVNEAEAGLDRLAAMRRWVGQMAAYIKELDPNHLVGSSFSFYERLSLRDHMIETFSLPELDYCDVHIYPAAPHMAALLPDADALLEVVDDLAGIGQVVGKPMLIGEVGFGRGEEWGGLNRTAAFDVLLKHGFAAGLAGVLVWSYSDPGWDDRYEINWQKTEDAGVCSVMAAWGGRFAAAPVRSQPRDGDGQWRVNLREHVLEAEPVPPVVVGNRLLYRIPVRGYDRARWINFGYWDGGKAFGSVYAKDYGHFVYPLSSTVEQRVKAARLRVRLTSDYPPVPQADSLGRTQVTVALNGRELATLAVRPVRYFGTVYDIEIAPSRGALLVTLRPGRNELVFSVKESASQRNGIALLGPALAPEYADEALPILLELELAD